MTDALEKIEVFFTMAKTKHDNIRAGRLDHLVFLKSKLGACVSVTILITVALLMKVDGNIFKVFSVTFSVTRAPYRLAIISVFTITSGHFLYLKRWGGRPLTGKSQVLSNLASLCVNLSLSKTFYCSWWL